MKTHQNTRSTWRDHWFVRIILTEIPIVGGFFKTSNVREALDHAGSSTAMILGATTTMMFFSVTNMQESDSMETKFAKMTVDMSTGMAGGVILYRTLFLAGERLHSRFKEPNAEEDKLIEENSPQAINEKPNIQLTQ